MIQVLGIDGISWSKADFVFASLKSAEFQELKVCADPHKPCHVGEGSSQQTHYLATYASAALIHAMVFTDMLVAAQGSLKICEYWTAKEQADKERTTRGRHVRLNLKWQERSQARDVCSHGRLFCEFAHDPRDFAHGSAYSRHSKKHRLECTIASSRLFCYCVVGRCVNPSANSCAKNRASRFENCHLDSLTVRH